MRRGEAKSLPDHPSNPFSDDDLAGKLKENMEPFAARLIGARSELRVHAKCSVASSAARHYHHALGHTKALHRKALRASTDSNPLRSSRRKVIRVKSAIAGTIGASLVASWSTALSRRPNHPPHTGFKRALDMSAPALACAIGLAVAAIAMSISARRRPGSIHRWSWERFGPKLATDKMSASLGTGCVNIRRVVAGLLLAAGALAAALAPARAEEGMWTFDNFPSAAVAKTYGFAPDQKWLDHVRLASVRLAGGCSAAFVSPRGLVQTNHHCAVEFIEQLSSAGHNLVAEGFYARSEADERKCPAIEANQLIAITPVTDRIMRATDGKDGAAFAAALKAAKAKIAAECSRNDDSLRCDVVELYGGGVYDLYKYRRYQDVRLVFSPEVSIAFFGGDPDNFEFPRYDFDVSFLRVYADGKPLDTSASYLRYAKADARVGDLVFTSGNPGSTKRLQTVAQLQYERAVALPRDIARLSDERGLLTQFAAESPEHARIARTLLFEVENTLKAEKGMFAALMNPRLIHDHAVAEEALRAKVDADAALRRQYGAAWNGIRATIERYRAQDDRLYLLADTRGFLSDLLGHALVLVRHVAEKVKPDGERLADYTEASFPELRQELLSDAPIHPELEKLRLTFSLTKLRELLGPDDDFVKKVLGDKSPAQLAVELIDNTKLADPALRRRLLDADLATLKASDDPMIKFALAIDPDLRAALKARDDGRDAALARYGAQIAAARFRVEGTSTYPDATFSPRLSYGTIAGYEADGRKIEPVTYVRGLYTRATGAEPFRLPPSWIAARAALDPDTPVNLATTNDFTGGGSGSPFINKDGEVIGLGFDGNIQHLGGAYGYDGAANRAVAVGVGILREGLAKVYHADRLVQELAQ
jgi:hypothetical protein